MMIHPVHAVALATYRHRELVARADEFRAAGRVPAGGPDRSGAADGRVPAAPTGVPAACRPDPRPAVAGRIGRRRPRFGYPGHRAGARRRVR